MRDWVQQKEEESCQEQEGRTVSQEKGSAAAGWRDLGTRQTRASGLGTRHERQQSARNSLVAGKGFLGSLEQSQNKIGSLPCKFLG